VIIVFSAVGGIIFITNQYAPSNIAVVVLEPGFGDYSMADQAFEGLSEVEVIFSYQLEVSEDAAAAQAYMEGIAAGGRYDLIVAIGDGLADAVTSAASAYTNQKFALIGAVPSLALDNVASATFSHEQAAFLAGSIAAHMSSTRSRTVGVLGSVEGDPTLEALIAGFVQGFYHANSTYNLDVELLPIDYVGSYNDSATAFSKTYSMFNPLIGNASVIFAPVRASILGVRGAMDQANESWFSAMPTRAPFVIAAEGDQDYLGNPNIQIRTGPSWIVTSVIPRTDLAVSRFINATLWFAFPGGVTDLYNLENMGVGLSEMEFRQSTWVTNFMLNVTADYRNAIINGSIVVDSTLP
jgi:basic membrane protein A